MSSEAPTPEMLSLIEAATAGLEERLLAGPLMDNVTQTKLANDATITDLFGHLDLRYGISEWLSSPDSKILPIYDEKENKINFYFLFPYSSFYREEGEGDERKIIITGMCQTHANALATLIDASTTHADKLAVAMAFSASDGITTTRHIIPEITDPQLASPLDRNAIDPGPTNRQLTMVGDGNRARSTNPLIHVVEGTGFVLAKLPSSLIVNPVFDALGNVEGIYSHMGSASIIDDVPIEGQIDLAAGKNGKWLFVRIRGQLENTSWIVINLETEETQRFDYGDSEDCRRYADLFVEKIDMSRFEKDPQS